MKNGSLWVVMPVYNEERCLPSVLDEWLPALASLTPSFTFLALNDGSKDHSLEVLRNYQKKYPQIEVVDKPNSGHGQSCIAGYQMAIERGAEWVLQIDSDGQCDPQYFARFWEARNTGCAFFGFRRTRADGRKRIVISRCLSLVLYLCSRTWVRDPNVPYRLVRTDVLKRAISGIPSDFYLANVLVSQRIQAIAGIKWFPIHFRNRLFGVSSSAPLYLLRQSLKLVRQLQPALRPEMEARPVEQSGARDKEHAA